MSQNLNSSSIVVDVFDGNKSFSSFFQGFFLRYLFIVPDDNLSWEQLCILKCLNAGHHLTGVKTV